MPEGVTDHHTAMLAAGWEAVPSLDSIEYWQDPGADWHKYPDWEAEAAYWAGDCRNVPRVRRLEDDELMWGLRNGK